MWIQKEIKITKKTRGFHLITHEIINQLPEIESIKVGLLHCFIKHTSASLAINENADPTVRQDLESHFNIIAPENQSYYQHTDEGPDDMPGHIKSVLIGSSQTVPVSNGQLNLGIWQGIYLCEHRNHSVARTLVLTLNGE